MTDEQAANALDIEDALIALQASSVEEATIGADILGTIILHSSIDAMRERAIAELVRVANLYGASAFVARAQIHRLFPATLAITIT